MSSDAHDDRDRGAVGGALPSTRDIVHGVFGAVKEYGKLAGQLPADDYDYHQAFPAFRARVREHGEGLVALMRACAQLLPARRRLRLAPEQAPVSGAVVVPEAQRAGVMEAIDSLLENVDAVLDELRGRRLHGAAQLGVSFGSAVVVHNNNNNSSSGSASSLSLTAMHDYRGGGGGVQVAAVMRPQLHFATPVDNTATPFVPVYYDADGQRHVGEAGVHPFADAVRAFRVPDAQLRVGERETPPLPLSQCPLHLVDTDDALRAMATTLLQHAREVAVDLEHHSFHSYQGFTCLMQLSTRDADYIVDCLRLRASMHVLAPVFLHPGIVKVLHGAREDVRWLQKDFGLYLVNFFDTSIALQALHMPHSLAFAVDHFCQVRLDKKYQTADWRVRPLPAEMVNYARYDTHFLLYIYDRLRALLLNSEGGSGAAATADTAGDGGSGVTGPRGNLLMHVYKESQRLSLQLYEKPTLQPDTTYKLALGRSLGGLTAAQERVARALFNWRDAAARRVDDSPSAVLHLSSVLAVASKLPRTASELLRCCHPVSAVVRGHLPELVALVRRAARGKDVDNNDDDNDDDSDGEHDERTVQPHVDADDASAQTGDAAMRVRVHAAHVHRAMTGTMPSIESCIGPPLTVTETATAAEHTQADSDDGDVPVTRLTCTQPSQWLCSMRQLSRTLAQRPQHVVPLPGSTLLLATQAPPQQQQQQERTKDEHDDARDDDEEKATTATNVKQVGDDNSCARDNNDNNDATRVTTTTTTVPREAVAIRQAYGIATRKRRRAH